MIGMVTILINGKETVCRDAISVAAALLSSLGTARLRQTARTGEPRGMFCGMGVCFDCLVTIDGRPNVRACMARVRQGMRIEVE